MKIVFFIDGFRKGGKERRLLELLKEIERLKIHYLVVIIHPEIEYSIPHEIRDKTIQINKYKKKDLSPFFAFFKICKDFNPDIIHTWSSMVTLYSLPTKKILQIKLINSQITDAPQKLKNWTLFGITCRINFFFSDLIIANSYAGLAAYNAPLHKTRVIYNGVDISRFDIKENKESIKKKLNISTKYSVIMVASFSDNKDYSTFINIALELQKIRNDVSFIAVGAGKNYLNCKQLVEELHLINFCFLGKRDDVEIIMNACDIGVLFSNDNVHGEGISNSIIEYMAMHMPVIANNNGGNKEIIENGYNGFVCKTNIVKESVLSMNLLLDNRDQRVRMGNNARKTVENKFVVQRMLNEFLDTYRIEKK